MTLTPPRCTCGHEPFGHVIDPDMTCGPCEQLTASGRPCGCAEYLELAAPPEYVAPSRGEGLAWSGG